MGSLCVGIAGPRGAESFGYRFAFDDRLTNKRAFAATALNLLRIVLKDGMMPDLAVRARPIWADRLVPDEPSETVAGTGGERRT